MSLSRPPLQIKDRAIDAAPPLKIWEKNEGIGGTWWENRYPGCACDIPAHSHQYTFEPNPNWSSFFAPAREIRQYLTAVQIWREKVRKTVT
ncbi:hypothetical protein VTL71DRAFT_3055 [Oculimacula yallundae]|uniref:Uncharacterized protein n=1 Tax=Oculimacula yallundae TaxID=86028 RepID=A0ABR4C616_9HELO